MAGRESEFSGMNRGNKILVRRALVTRRLRRPRVFASTAGEFPRNSRTKLAQETRLRRPLRHGVFSVFFNHEPHGTVPYMVRVENAPDWPVHSTTKA